MVIVRRKRVKLEVKKEGNHRPGNKSANGSTYRARKWTRERWGKEGTYRGFGKKKRKKVGRKKRLSRRSKGKKNKGKKRVQ